MFSNDLKVPYLIYFCSQFLNFCAQRFFRIAVTVMITKATLKAHNLKKCFMSFVTNTAFQHTEGGIVHS